MSSGVELVEMWTEVRFLSKVSCLPSSLRHIKRAICVGSGDGYNCCGGGDGHNFAVGFGVLCLRH